jgi:hypothetical protein
MRLQELPVETITFMELPSYWRIGSVAPKGNTYIRCGEVKRGGNEPNCYAQEKNCAGHICRVLKPESTYDKALVIRDDGTVWDLWLPAFKELHLLKIGGDNA